jgi:LacI family transcriptional regulator, galactose operon repressor
VREPAARVTTLGDPGRRVRLADVARLVGVDPSVVSRVANDDPRLLVRPETRERILAAIDELGYRPNVVARNLRRSASDMYGLIIPNFSNPIYAQIIAGAEAGALHMGKYLLASSSVDFNSDGYLAAIGNGRVDGLLIAGTVATTAQRLDASRVPWLFLNRSSPGRPRHVVLDDERATAMAVEHLVGLGHERIAHLAGPPTADTAQRRKSGYLRAMQGAGLRAREGDVVASDYTDRGGAEAMRRLVSGGSVTAVVVANVASAIGALWAANELGIRVPEELSVVTVHDLPLATYLIPPLTTVRMPLLELGARGVEILSKERAGARVEEVVRAPMELVERGSAGPPPEVPRPRQVRKRK